MAPRKRLRIGDRDVLVLGTIAGFEPHGDRVRAAFAESAPCVLALGIPPEDVEGLHTLAADPDVELPEPGPVTERLFEWLAPFGKTRTPSPDLEAAFLAADAADIPIEALDLDDEDHAEVYIRANKFRHVVQAGRVQKKLLKQDFGDHDSAEELVLAWDAFQNRLPGLRAVETARETHMAERLLEVAATARGDGGILAVVPLARMDGILAALAKPPSDDAADDA